VTDHTNSDNANAPQVAATNPATDALGAEPPASVPVAPGLGPEVALGAGDGVLPDLTLLGLEELLNLDPTDDSGPAGRSLETDPLQASSEDAELPADLTALDLDRLLELDLGGTELPTLLEVAGLTARNQGDEGEQNGPPDGVNPPANAVPDDEDDDGEPGSEDDFELEASLGSDVAPVDIPAANSHAEAAPSNAPVAGNGQGNGANAAIASGNNAGGNSANVGGGSENGNAGGNSANAGSASDNGNAGGNSANVGSGNGNGNAGGNSGNNGGSSTSNAGGNSGNVGASSDNGNAGGNSANVGSGSPINNNAGGNPGNNGGSSSNNAGGNSDNVGGGSANRNTGNNAGGNSGNGAGAIAVAAAGITFPGGGDLPVAIAPADTAPAVDAGQVVPASVPVSVPSGPPAGAPLAYSPSTFVPASESNGQGSGNGLGVPAHAGPPDRTPAVNDLPAQNLPPAADSANTPPPAAPVAGTTVNGSGAGDLLTGTAGNDVLTGKGGNDSLNGGAGDDTLKGGGGDDFLDGGAGADDLSGGGGADVLVWDFNDINIDGGGGADTLRVGGGDADITTFGGTVTGIEIVDLATDGGANALTLTAQDVLDMSGTDTLTVSGNALDSVDAGTGWTDGGVSGGNHIYTQVIGPDTATLVVDADLAVNANILV
jgi:hypothetical protein